MLGPFDYVVWCLGFFAEVYVVVWALKHRIFSRYLTLNLYMLSAALVTVGEFFIMRWYGFTSIQYKYFYYYTDCLTTVLLYFAVMGLYGHVFREMGANKHVRRATVLLLFITAGFSYVVVARNQHNLTNRFVLELAQNLYFVGVVLSYLLWAAVMKLRETRVRLIQLVLALGIYFSAFAATYALRNLFPGFGLLKVVPPLVATWLPLAWAYTFTRIPEEARLATAHLVARPR